MPRKTREQKVIADLRRQLQLRDGVIKEAAPSRPSISAAPVISLPTTRSVSAAIKEPATATHLKVDLLKVSGLVALSVILELIVSLAITSGALKPLGLS